MEFRDNSAWEIMSAFWWEDQKFNILQKRVAVATMSFSDCFHFLDLISLIYKMGVGNLVHL